MSEIELSCTECDGLFPDYFEGDLDPRRRARVDAHVAGCARCQGIARDVGIIRAEAQSLVDIAPSRDLWSGIEERIEPAVVAIGTRRERAPISRWMMGIAAAGLVVVSSGVTWLATRGIDRAPLRVVAAPASASLPLPGNETRSTPVMPEPVETPPQQATPAVKSLPAAGSSSGLHVPAGGRMPSAGRTALASSRRVAPPTASELALAPEIADLQRTLRQRRDQLDPETVRVVEDNLKLIDVAVAQAKAALLRDPASGFLTQQLDGALQKKLELLRTVAMLPSRT